MTEVLFYIFAVISVVAALAILFTKNVLYAACALVVCFLGVAALYVLSGAEFLAVTQIMIYVGGIVVLMIFAVMLTNKLSGVALATGSHNRFLGLIVAGGVFGGLLYVIYKVNFPVIVAAKEANNISAVGKGLMSDYIFPFEMAAVLLLVALVGAATIAGEKIKEKDNAR